MTAFPYHGFLPRKQLDELLDLLKEQADRCVGPVVKQGSIVYTDIDSAEQLPSGVRDHQSPGHYQLKQDDSPRHFNWANGPQALKPLLFRPEETLWQVQKTPAGELVFQASEPVTERMVFFGARACDLAALSLQDAHFLGTTPDPAYQKRRNNIIIIAVNCTQPADTCFCHATGDGPTVKNNCDIALDELDEGFACIAQTDTGKQILDQLDLIEVTQQQDKQIRDEQARAANMQTRTLPDGDVRSLLMNAASSKHWHEIAERCLSCGNCTSVCPSCFCSRSVDEPDSDGSNSTHIREWDSCFTADHSYIHGIVLRKHTDQRYRQWLTHKFAGWIDQYGRSGCVGCGRCISWCPVGIDVTEELHHFARGIVNE